MQMNSLACAVALAFAAQLWAAKARAEQMLPPRNVGQVRGLSVMRAQAAVPIHLSGVVMALSGWKNSFFLANKTAGISVDRNDTGPELPPGNQVEVEARPERASLRRW